MNDEQIAEHSNRIFVEHERLKREAANLRDELKQAEAERDHLRRALEWTIAKMQGCDTYQCPYPCPDGQHGDDGRCMGTLEGCWMIAALAATEEASR